MNDDDHSDDVKGCPFCGADLPGAATSCRHCGADSDSGWEDDWQDDEGYQATDDFDYDEFVRREFPEQSDQIGRFGLDRRRGWITAVAILLIVALVWLAIRGY